MEIKFRELIKLGETLNETLKNEEGCRIVYKNGVYRVLINSKDGMNSAENELRKLPRGSKIYTIVSDIGFIPNFENTGFMIAVKIYNPEQIDATIEAIEELYAEDLEIASE